jgi:hypothetical protein
MDLNLILKFFYTDTFFLKKTLPIFYTYLHSSIIEFPKEITYLFNNLTDDDFINSKKLNKVANI